MKPAPHPPSVVSESLARREPDVFYLRGPARATREEAEQDLVAWRGVEARHAAGELRRRPAPSPVVDLSGIINPKRASAVIGQLTGYNRSLKIIAQRLAWLSWGRDPFLLNLEATVPLP